MAIAPLKLKKGEHILWEVKDANSRDSCRPLSQTWAKETQLFMGEKTQDFFDQISALQDTNLEYTGNLTNGIDGGIIEHDIKLVAEDDCKQNTIKVKHSVIPSMWDGKSLIAIANKHYKELHPGKSLSTKTCHLCLKSMQVFKLDFKSPIILKDTIQYGMAVLHVLLRVFEDLVKAAVKKLSQKHKIKRGFSLDLFKKRFRKYSGIRMFEVRQGSGTSNDGNTARAFFKDPTRSAELLEINPELVLQTRDLIGMISNQKEFIYSDLFDNKAKLVWELYNNEFNECGKNMSTTFHRLVAHGGAFLNYAKELGIPLGQLSESSIESINSLNRTVRQFHTRKCGAMAQNLDLLNHMIWRSDPLLNHTKR